MPWTETEFNTIDLGDKRNNVRAIKIAEAIAPQSSIPQSCEDWAETLGTYRFYSNEYVSAVLPLSCVSKTQQSLILMVSK